MTYMRLCLSISALGVLLAPSPATASSAWFTVRCEEIALGEPVDGIEPPQYRLQLELGKPLTLIAEGIVAPRGGVPQPFEPEAGSWTFDEAVFERLEHDTKKYGKTMLPIRLKALKAGETRVQFNGSVLGYERRYDVIVNVVMPD